MSGKSNEPLEPSIVGTLGKVKLILSKEPLSLAIACSGKIYSILAIAPITALILFKLSGLKTSEPNVLVTSPAKLFGFSPTGPVGKPLASFINPLNVFIFFSFSKIKSRGANPPKSCMHYCDTKIN